ncbi:MAG: hypothetical protein V2A79_06180, partial [Planctomycetota bacterium]
LGHRPRAPRNRGFQPVHGLTRISQRKWIRCQQNRLERTCEHREHLFPAKRVKLYCRLEPQFSCGIGTFAIEGVDNAKLVDHLFAKHRIITVAIDHPTMKGVRVTPNVYTTLEEIDMFCEAVETVLADGLPA